MTGRISPDTEIGSVTLTVRDLARQRRFYEETIGLSAVGEGEGEVQLGSAGGPALVKLVWDPDAPPRPPGTTGLFHHALLVPGRRDLAVAIARIWSSGWALTGASDHLVSEAIYLDDPEGNGIEIYRDRPRDAWEREDGELKMATLALDLAGVLGELPPGLDPGPGTTGVPPMPAGTRMGHIHLNVASIPQADAFYREALGLDVMLRGYPGALFLAAGGYHHHVGVNTWGGADPPPPGAVGLREFELAVPDRGEVGRVAGRLEAAGMDVEERGDQRISASDPSGNRVVIAARAGTAGSGGEK